MLNRVPKAVNFSIRQVVLRHPNAMDCTVYRKRALRTEIEGGEASTFGGSPTLGGMGVLDSADEAEFEYAELGEGRMLMVGPYEPAQVNDRGDAISQPPMSEAQIVSVAAEGKPGHFVPDNHDMVVAYIGAGIALTYQVMQPIGNINIPPYSVRYVLTPRDDLHYIEPFASRPDAATDDPPIGGFTPTD